MPTAAWKGFIHSWHTLAIVLKWMCITVVGIPVAIATCLVVAVAVLAFAALVLLAVAGICAIVFFVFKGIFCLAIRIPYWVKEIGIRRAERRLFRLPVSEARAVQVQRWPGVRPFHRIPDGSIVATQVPQQAHIAPATSRESPPTPATELPGMLECQVCLEKKLPDDFPTRQPTEACSHPVDCCKHCLSQCITAAFEGRIWDDIRCPTCNLRLQHQDVAEFASRGIFERYDTLSTRRTLESQLPNFRWCLGPNCSFGQEHPDDPKQPMITCSSCGFVSCLHHNTHWHAEMTCEEYDVKIAAGALLAEKRSEKVIKKLAKRCPGCRRYINKNGGCPHMSCPCGREFCWTCLHDYPGHTWTCKDR